MKLNHKTRRVLSSIALAAIVLSSHSTVSAAETPPKKEAVKSVRLVLPGDASPVVKNIGAVFTRQVQQRCEAKVITTGDAPLTVELAVEKGLDRSAAKVLGRVWEAELSQDVARVEALWHRIVEGKMTACVMLFAERGAALLEGKTLREFAAEKELDGVLHVLHVRDARETSASRMRRISDADALRRRCAQVLRPLYECIGHCDARRDRQEWRKLLDERFELERRERDVESDLRILCGDIDDRLKSVVLRDEQFIVAFFLSSTFTDTEWERNLLIDDVVPYLQDYARKHGFEFRLAEMRW